MPTRFIRRRPFDNKTGGAAMRRTARYAEQPSDDRLIAKTGNTRLGVLEREFL